MRERRPGDWRVDLARRHHYEAHIERAIDDHGALTRLASSTNSLDRLDYQVLGPNGRLIEIELKAKHQHYRGWTDLRPDVAERDLFILDELALRKLVDAGRYAVLLVRDDPGNRWIVWTLMDLVLAPKARVARRLATGTDRTKGKVLLDLGDTAHHLATPPDALDRIAELSTLVDDRWRAIEAWPTHHPIGLAS